MFLNHQKLELIEKILNAKLTDTELTEVIGKAEEMLNRRTDTQKEKE